MDLTGTLPLTDRLYALTDDLLDSADLLETAHVLAVWSAVLAGRLEQTVDAARADGATWQQVADAVGLNSKQAAQARYR
jgi:AraC-like DNA-binding protein